MVFESLYSEFSTRSADVRVFRTFSGGAAEPLWARSLLVSYGFSEEEAEAIRGTDPQTANSIGTRSIATDGTRVYCAFGPFTQGSYAVPTPVIIAYDVATGDVDWTVPVTGNGITHVEDLQIVSDGSLVALVWGNHGNGFRKFGVTDGATEWTTLHADGGTTRRFADAGGTLVTIGGAEEASNRFWFAVDLADGSVLTEEDDAASLDKTSDSVLAMPDGRILCNRATIADRFRDAYGVQFGDSDSSWAFFQTDGTGLTAPRVPDPANCVDGIPGGVLGVDANYLYVRANYTLSGGALRSVLYVLTHSGAFVRCFEIPARFAGIAALKMHGAVDQHGTFWFPVPMREFISSTASREWASIFGVHADGSRAQYNFLHQLQISTSPQGSSDVGAASQVSASGSILAVIGTMARIQGPLAHFSGTETFGPCVAEECYYYYGGGGGCSGDCEWEWVESEAPGEFVCNEAGGLLCHNPSNECECPIGHHSWIEDDRGFEWNGPCDMNRKYVRKCGTWVPLEGNTCGCQCVPPNLRGDFHGEIRDSGCWE